MTDTGSAVDATVKDCIIEQRDDVGINTGNVVLNNEHQGILVGGGANDCTISDNVVHGTVELV